MSIRRLAILGLLSAAAGCGGKSYNPLTAHFNRGVAAYNEGRISEAIEAYKLAALENPRDYKALFNLGIIYHDQKDYDEALAYYERALKGDPKNGRVMANIASVKLAQGRTDEALAMLEQAAQADRASAFPYYTLGSYYDRQGDPAKASAYYDKALARDKNHVETRFQLGRRSEEAGKIDEAIGHYDTAVRTSPQDVPSLLALARACEKKGDAAPAGSDEAKRLHELASKYLERVTILQPSRDDVYLSLARVQEKAGKLEKAVGAAWEARTINKDGEAVAPALRRLYVRLLRQEGGPEVALPEEVKTGGEEKK